MLMSELNAAVQAFDQRLKEVRADIQDVSWYPYGSLSNIGILASFIASDTEMVPANGSAIDIGAADGDMGYLFHSLGCEVDFLDNAPTNFNGCKGIRATGKSLGHSGRLIERDLDLGFELDRDYDLAIFLGALYHLRNPALALIRLAQHCRTMVLSTRVMSHLPTGERVSDYPIAYLLDKRESNGDPTNWWVFSHAGLTRLLRRCGWETVFSASFGALERSNPVASSADERYFVYCRRVPNYGDLLIHHDF
jgi:hypothetical protein